MGKENVVLDENYVVENLLLHFVRNDVNSIPITIHPFLQFSLVISFSNPCSLIF